MTDITDTEAAEVLWASSEQGKAALKAGMGVIWERIGEWSSPANARDITLSALDLRAVIFSAVLASEADARDAWERWYAEPDEDEPAPAHDHHWTILGAQPHTPAVMFGKPVPYTIVLIRCTECGEPDSRMLPGEWALHELQEDPA